MAVEKSEAGARLTALDGDNHRLKEAVRCCMEKALRTAGIGFDAVGQVAASGMITSNMGLFELPHIAAPAGANELAKASVETVIEDVCPLPILFIPGIKNRESSSIDSFEEMDIMRGEEVESIAILNHFPQGKGYLIILPGSHTKLIAVNKQGQISGCLTTISGELLSAVTMNTIIAEAVGHAFVQENEYDRDMVLLGYRTAKRTGTGRACFAARILSQFAVRDKKKLANYLLGAVLQNDLMAVQGSQALSAGKETTVIVSGKQPFRRALMDLFEEDGGFPDIREFAASADVPLSAEGAFIITDLRKKGWA